MDKHAIYEVWAPAASAWSAWAKPTVFSHLIPAGPAGAELAAGDVSSLPPAEKRCALVLDLPGVDSVRMALALAARGYQPVPLFNACPAPPASPAPALTAVDVAPISAAICAGTPTLLATPVPAEAPPVFLLDGNRADATRTLDAGVFDNRSVVFAADFPSAAYLQERGILRCLVVHPPGRSVGDDLRHALRHWTTAGLPVEVIATSGEPIEISWPKNGFFGELAIRVFAFFRLRRNPRGGFGAFVPESSAG